MHPGTIHPREKAELFDNLRIHPAELTAAHILPFVPRAAEIDQDKEKRLESIARIIADCSSVHAAVTWILENEEWDFAAVYYDAIDHFSHGFMNFHPPRMKWVNKERYEQYKGVVSGGYLYHDMMLGRLLQLAGEDTTVILVSDHGFHSDHLRPKGLPKEPAGPAWQHRSYGIFVMKGPSIRKDERIYGASLLDVTPTILTLFGLPAGQDMDGKPIVQVFEKPVLPDPIPSWEDVPGECGMHPADVRPDPYAEQEAMQQLIALGYVEPPGKNVQKAIERTVNESEFYLARVHMNKKQHDLALPLLERIHNKQPDQVRYAFQLAKCYQTLGKLRECKKVTEEILKSQKKEYPQLDLLRGSLALAEGLYHQALEYFQKAEKAEPRLPTLHQQIGRVYFKLRRFDDAEGAYGKALEIDPDSPAAHHGMALVCLRKRANEDAAQYALNAVGLLYHFPQAHYTLGVACSRIGYFERAAEAFEVCLSISPGFRTVRRILIRLYRLRLGRPEKAEEHRSALRSLKKQKEESSHE
jgi:tetratricopeptide (TPR) repeat protein